MGYSRLHQRRASERASLDGLARVEFGARAHSFRVNDLSFGGVGLTGDASAFRVGTRVRVLMTAANGSRLDVWAEVRRADEEQLGLAWSLFNPENAERIAYLVDDIAQRSRPAIMLPLIPQRAASLWDLNELLD
jgi:hypothetical protein